MSNVLFVPIRLIGLSCFERVCGSIERVDGSIESVCVSIGRVCVSVERLCASNRLADLTTWCMHA